MEKENILVAEEAVILNDNIRTYLEKKGYRVFQASTVKEAEIFLERERVDLILLGLTLPDGDGIEFCKQIRKESFMPIIFVSGIEERGKLVEALKNGGDDFVVKSVDMEELLARIESNIRRSRIYQRGRHGNNSIRTFHQFAVETARHQVWRVEKDGKRGRRLHLSPLEYKILEMFIDHEGKLMTYEEIYQYIWKNDDLGDVRTVMVHVSNLRKKINYLDSNMISTVRGTGYVFHDK